MFPLKIIKSQSVFEGVFIWNAKELIVGTEILLMHLLSNIGIRQQ